MQTQNTRIVDYIIRRGSITNMEAFRDLAITRLSGRIYELRQLGIPIYCEWEHTEDGNRFARYRIKEEWIREHK